MRRLKRVREQLDKLDGLMFEEADPKRLKEYADASARLSDQEFKLAGRPNPGSRRPAQERASKGRDAGAWLAEPMPATVAPVANPVIIPQVPEPARATPEPEPIRPPGTPDRAEYL